MEDWKCKQLLYEDKILVKGPQFYAKLQLSFLKNIVTPSGPRKMGQTVPEEVLLNC